MIEKLTNGNWIYIEDRDVKKDDIIRYITNRSVMYKVEQDAYLSGFSVYNFSLSEVKSI